MGGGHHQKLPEVPDWRIYKVQDVPQLVLLQKALASHGLKDPWLRNEVWRYTEYENKTTLWRNFKYLFSRGIKGGVIAGILTAILEKTLLPSTGHHEHEAHH